MSEAIRQWLYPLGFISTVVFFVRMLLQWIKSESLGRSHVTRGFWQLSIIGNCLLALHAFIQLQFHVYIVQVCNAHFAGRNLTLNRQISTKKNLTLLAVNLTLATFAFYLQASGQWFRTPFPLDYTIGIGWHLFGFFGIALFNSRFLVQWWHAETHKVSVLSKAFWQISLIGELICLIYFLKIRDPVNLIGPAFAMIPYARNLILLKSR